MPAIDRSQVWESLAIEIDPVDLVEAVVQAEENEDKERVEALLCGAVKLLRNYRAKPDQLRLNSHSQKVQLSMNLLTSLLKSKAVSPTAVGPTPTKR
jgi:hypothetical protein